jgi:hypothetical protein
MLVAAAAPSGIATQEWLALTIALAAVIVGPTVQLIIANRDRMARNEEMAAQLAAQRALTEKQIYAAVRSSNRQAWINSLRDEIAQCLSISAELLVNASSAKWAQQKGVSIENIPPELRPKIFELTKLVALIELRLNPKESDHVELLQNLRALITNIETGALDNNWALQRLVIDKSQAILKTEWERVKRCE